MSVYGPFKTLYNQACDNWMRQKEKSVGSVTFSSGDLVAE